MISSSFWKLASICYLSYSCIFPTSQGLCFDRTFECSNTRCIPFYYKCDGANDCFDSSDETSCTPEEKEPILSNFLVVADIEAPGLYQISLSTESVRQLLQVKPLRLVAVALDEARKDIYYSDIRANTISRYSLRTAQVTVIHTDVTNTSAYHGLAVDSASRLLYYSNARKRGDDPDGSIGEISLDGRNKRTLIRETGLGPEAIVIDSRARMLYWSERGYHPGIYRAPITAGAQKTALVTSGVILPNALAIDFTQQLMYWADIKSHKLERSNLDGSERRTVLEDQAALYFALALSPSYIYFTDWRKRSVQRIDRHTEAEKDMKVQAFNRLMGIALFSGSFIPDQTSSATTKKTTRVTRLSVSTDNGTIRTTTYNPLLAGTTNNGEARGNADDGVPMTTIILVAAVAGGVVIIALIVTIGVIIVVRSLRHRRKRRSPEQDESTPGRPDQREVGHAYESITPYNQPYSVIVDETEFKNDGPRTTAPITTRNTNTDVGVYLHPGHGYIAANVLNN